MAKRTLLLAVGLVLVGVTYWALVRTSETKLPEVSHVLERFVDQPSRLHFAPPDATLAITTNRQTHHEWVSEEIKETWKTRIDNDVIIYVSPRLDFDSVTEVDSIIIELSSAVGLDSFTLHWSDAENLPRSDFLRNWRQLRNYGKQHSARFLVKGDSISDVQFSGTAADEKPLHFLFIRFPRTVHPVPQLDNVKVLSKMGRFAVQPFGKYRHVVRGEVRDTLFVRTPGEITYQPTKADGGELLFGVYNLLAGSTVRYCVRASDATGRTTIFDREVRGDGRWHDFRVRLPFGVREITLRGESDANGNVAFWSNPMILHSQSTGRPNIVLYVVDALRPDRLGAYGYTKGTSPFLDRLAEQGIVFQNCYAAASWTKPAIASLFTSLYPQTHGVGRHSYLDVLPDSVPTLQDELRSHGYLTAQFSANPLSGTLSNLDQGFDYTFGPNAFEMANTESKQNKTHSDDLNRRVLPWLEAHSDDQFFLYIHSIDPHRPLSPPVVPSHLGKERSPDVLYDAEVHFNDSQLKRLYDKLIELDRADQTLFVVTSDHGEALNERGRFGHGISVYEEEVRIPLIMVDHGALRSAVVRDPVHAVDITPMILGHVSISVDWPMVQGTDVLAPDHLEDLPRKIFLSKFTFPNSNSVGDYDDLEMYAVIEDRWKLIENKYLGNAEPVFELYDLSDDPLEQRDLSDSQRDEVHRLHALLREFLEKQEKERTAFIGTHYGTGSRKGDHETILPVEVLDQLRSLGYIH